MTTSLIQGLSGAIGSRYVRSRNQLVFVEFGGKVSALDLVRPAASSAHGQLTFKGTWYFDCETGTLGSNTAGDLWWEQMTTSKRQMAPVNGAKLCSLGKVSWASVNHATLQGLPYSAAPIIGNDDASNQLTNGTVLAVKTNGGNYTKVQVLAYGYDMVIRWQTYKLASPYHVLGTGYHEPEDIAVAADGNTAYVSERGGTIVRVSLAGANRASAVEIATGLTAPHQLHLDETAGHLYAAEFGTPGKLLRIALDTGAITTLASDLDRAVGLVVTGDRRTAYVSEQASAGGRIAAIDLGGGGRRTVASGLTEPFMMTWADPSETRLLLTERGAARRLTAIDLTASPAVVTQVETGLPDKPSSCALVSAERILICCDAEIVEDLVEAIRLAPGAPLLMGIGKVPVSRISPAGRADTSVDPSYPYQFRDVPFGGTMPLLINHQRAWDAGARYYRVTVDDAPRFDGYTGYRWNTALAAYQVRTVGATTLSAGPGYYPVHGTTEQWLWLEPALGLRLASPGLSDTVHTVKVDFVNGSGVALFSSDPLQVQLDNRRCVALLAAPTVDGVEADAECGVLRYQKTLAGPSGAVVMGFSASHPGNYATWSFSLLKGVRTLAPPSTSGPVPSPGTPITRAVSEMLGPCAAPPGVAAFSEHLYVAATAINGEGRLTEYDASAARAFVLVPT